MKTLILYGSHTKLTNAHKLVTGNKQPEFYVRSDLFSGDLADALDNANPLNGEIVLNTVKAYQSIESLYES